MFIYSRVHLEFMKPQKKKSNNNQDSNSFFRVRLPGNKQVFGILESRLGGSRSRVICSDGKVRVCRIPGRLKRELWVRPGDILIVEPWEFGGDEKGDIVYKYRKSEEQWLRRRGYLNFVDELGSF